jgi:hypothetical protein
LKDSKVAGEVSPAAEQEAKNLLVKLANEEAAVNPRRKKKTPSEVAKVDGDDARKAEKVTEIYRSVDLPLAEDPKAGS